MSLPQSIVDRMNLPKRTVKSELWYNRQLQRYTYKPGWEFHIIESPSDLTPALVINATTIDTYNPKHTVIITSRFPLIGIYPNEKMFLAVLRDGINAMENHESKEWFRRDGEIYDNPHKPRRRWRLGWNTSR